MRSLPRRRLYVAAAVVVAIVATVLIAGAAGSSSGSKASTATWDGSWAAAVTPAAPDTPATKTAAAVPSISLHGFNDQTVRMTIHASIGGSAARLRLSNEFGTQPLVVGHVTLALPTKSGSGALVPGSVHDVQFNGQGSVTIPTGGELWSDPVPMTVAADTDVAVSIWLPSATGPATNHPVSRTTTWIGKGDHSADMSNEAFTTKDVSWYYVTGLDVRNSDADGTIVILGDSVSDGYLNTVDADHRWPDFLADRLGKLPASDHAPGVLDVGLSGSALGHDGKEIGVPQLGPASTARLDTDVFSQTGARIVFVELTINDIWIYHDSPDQIIGELRQVATQAHEHGLKVYISTVSPWGGYVAYTAKLDQTRTAVNQYIRSTKDFDGYVDFDQLLRDPEDPTLLKQSLNGGDGIHPDDTGAQEMANLVPLKWLVTSS